MSSELSGLQINRTRSELEQIQLDLRGKKRDDELEGLKHEQAIEGQRLVNEKAIERLKSADDSDEQKKT